MSEKDKLLRIVRYAIIVVVAILILKFLYSFVLVYFVASSMYDLFNGVVD